jgi:hypothetical protein
VKALFRFSHIRINKFTHCEEYRLLGRDAEWLTDNNIYSFTELEILAAVVMKSAVLEKTQILGDRFLRNIRCFSTDHTALCPRRQCSAYNDSISVNFETI